MSDQDSVAIFENTSNNMEMECDSLDPLNGNVNYSISILSLNQTNGISERLSNNNLSLTLAHEEKKLLQNKFASNQDTDKTRFTEEHLSAPAHLSVNTATTKNKTATNINSTKNKLNETNLFNESDLFQNSFIELGRRLWKSTPDEQQYTKGCLWSPDGSCILIPVNADGMHVIELPTVLYTMENMSQTRRVSDLNSAVKIKEGGTVYDCAWYPLMNSTQPETCCWIATRQHEPIHMWDAYNGELRCTYRGYDDVDEVETAIALNFSMDGKNIMGGYKKSIKIFDTDTPGRPLSTIPIKHAVSAFAILTNNNNFTTVGSWNGFIYHFDLRAPQLGPLFTLKAHTSGVTLLRAVQNKNLLFSGARKDNKIFQWDMRNFSKPVKEFVRNVNTNQRIYYDLSPHEEWLVSGDTDGLLRIWNMADETLNTTLPLHNDCCNGVHFHPSRPIIATSAGQYHFLDVVGDDDEIIVNYENSLVFWWYGKQELD